MSVNPLTVLIWIPVISNFSRSKITVERKTISDHVHDSDEYSAVDDSYSLKMILQTTWKNGRDSGKDFERNYCPRQDSFSLISND